jgi:hypothetical protein
MARHLLDMADVARFLFLLISGFCSEKTLHPRNRQKSVQQLIERMAQYHEKAFRKAKIGQKSVQ